MLFFQLRGVGIAGTVSVTPPSVVCLTLPGAIQLDRTISRESHIQDSPTASSSGCADCRCDGKD